jgi:hypothetical protein
MADPGLLYVELISSFSIQWTFSCSPKKVLKCISKIVKSVLLFGAYSFLKCFKIVLGYVYPSS